MHGYLEHSAEALSSLHSAGPLVAGHTYFAEVGVVASDATTPTSAKFESDLCCICCMHVSGA